MDARLLFVLGAAAIYGCAAPRAPLTAAEIADHEAPVCISQQHCDAMWDRAQLWVVKNGAYKIQTANNVLIQTYGPLPYAVESAFTITKEPKGRGEYSIEMRAYCDNIYGCTNNAVDLRLGFNRYLRQTQKD